MFQSFKELNIPAPLAKALEEMNFFNPTPVQAQAIPPALDGKDILGTAQTGTGKTAAFGIPLVTTLTENTKIDGLILAPTRELAAQIHMVLQNMTRGQKIYGCLVVGGESFHNQAKQLRDRVDYIVATPGRLNDHLEQGTVDLGRVGFLVLDEVDRMLDMGFAPQIKRIMRKVPEERQTLLFSATLPHEIVGLANTFLKNPVRVAIDAVAAPPGQVTEDTITTTHEGKNTQVLKEINEREGLIIIFVRTKSRADRLTKLIQREGHKVACMHGGRSQPQRKKALADFRSGRYRIMVATDLAGRGIDVNDIEHVINYDVPATREDYVHRVGRTGRYGKTGKALTFLLAGDFDGERVVDGKAPAAKKVVFSSSRRRRR